MTLTIKLDGNWSSFQLANSAPPLSVTDSAIAPSARMEHVGERRNGTKACLRHSGSKTFRSHVKMHSATASQGGLRQATAVGRRSCSSHELAILLGPEGPSKIQEVTLMRPIHGNL